MSDVKDIYKEKFKIGSSVQIANREFLEFFLRDWKFHHKLESVQLDWSDQIATVEQVGFYHGGTVLYKLAGVPGIWHEPCLKAYSSPL